MQLDLITTTPAYWQCKCQHNHVHPKHLPQCLGCLARQENCPDAQAIDVLWNLHTEHPMAHKYTELRELSARRITAIAIERNPVNDAILRYARQLVGLGLGDKYRFLYAEMLAENEFALCWYNASAGTYRLDEEKIT